jgi:hypothetical protein
VLDASSSRDPVPPHIWLAGRRAGQDGRVQMPSAPHNYFHTSIAPHWSDFHIATSRKCGSFSLGFRLGMRK